jgi:hypothetical protein
MLTYVSKHNSLAQAARVAEAAAAGITPKAQNPRRLHFPGEDGCIVFLDTHAMTAFKVTGEQETTAAEATQQRVASRRPKVCLPKSNRDPHAFLNMTLNRVSNQSRSQRVCLILIFTRELRPCLAS